MAFAINYDIRTWPKTFNKKSTTTCWKLFGSSSLRWRLAAKILLHLENTNKSSKLLNFNGLEEKTHYFLLLLLLLLVL